MPMRLIPVAVRALPVDDQAAVAYLLRKERLEYLEGLERPADAPAYWQDAPAGRVRENHREPDHTKKAQYSETERPRK